MVASSSNSSSPKFSRYWPWFFFAAAFESLFAIASLLLIPSEGRVSLARLALLGILFLLFATGMFLGFRARKDSTSFDFLARTPFILFATLLFLISGLSLFLLRYFNPERLLPYYERSSPLLWVLLVIASQAIFFFNLVKHRFHLEGISNLKSIYTAALFSFSVLLVMFLFVAITKIGITPDTAYWGEPGVAIQGWQFVIAILAGAIVTFYLSQTLDQQTFWSSVMIPIVLYGVAAVLWLSVPNSVLESSFYAPISGPTNMPMPYSDAGFYDYLSQSLLIGTNYLGGIPPRPFYVLFLAALHYLFGQNYPAIIAAQTLVLAFFPIALYFLAKKIHSPTAGVIVALFAIFRELVGLWISSNTRVVNSKMFTTDFPTAMAIAFICLVMLWWLERRDLKSTLVAGGAFGLLLLFRTQSLLTLPFVFILAWFVYQRKTKTWILAGVVFAFTMVVTVLPWLTRNYNLTGKFTFDDPNQMAIVYSQYSFNDKFNLQEFNIQSKSLGARMLEFTLQNPAYVARFVSTHFLNTEIGGLLTLPLIKDFESLSAPINLYWIGWDGSVEWYNLLLMLLYLVVISLGLGISWRRMGWLGLLPLAFNLGYALANGISRFSSWRYNLPVDWVIYFYFAIGIAELLYEISLLFGMTVNKEPVISKDISMYKFKPVYLLIPIVFAFIGALPWIAQGFAQPRYTSTKVELITKLEASGYSSAEIEAFMNQENAILMEGRMMYPRSYSRGRGVASANPWPAYAVHDFPRVGFLVVNQKQVQSIFPTRDPVDFSQGEDVILLGCQLDGYVEARVLSFGDKTYESIPLTELCASR